MKEIWSSVFERKSRYKLSKRRRLKGVADSDIMEIKQEKEKQKLKQHSNIFLAALVGGPR
jgi:hypothetical protein